VTKALTFTTPGPPVPMGRPRMSMYGHVFTEKRPLVYRQTVTTPPCVAVGIPETE